jgi:hypothetical protein
LKKFKVGLYDLIIDCLDSKDSIAIEIVH